MREVREEALRVQDRRQSLRARPHAHRLVVLVLVHLDDVVEALLESLSVRGESDHREDEVCPLAGLVVCADLEDFGCETGVDVVAGGRAGVAC